MADKDSHPGTNVVKAFRCDLCLKLPMLKRISICDNLHKVCETCQMGPLCSTCGTALHEQLMVSTCLDGNKLRCPNNNCIFIGTGAQLNEHVDKCIHRPFNCFVNECEEVMKNTTDFKQHLFQHHGAYDLKNPKMETSLTEEIMNRRKDRLGHFLSPAIYTHSGKEFAIFRRVTSSNFSAWIVGLDTTASKSTYDIGLKEPLSVCMSTSMRASRKHKHQEAINIYENPKLSMMKIPWVAMEMFVRPKGDPVKSHLFTLDLKFHNTKKRIQDQKVQGDEKKVKLF